MRPSLSTLLGKKLLLCDGAMGTQLMARGMHAGECPELWNVTRPDDVRAIHAAYVAAGCNLITTNTFGGTRTSLARHSLDARTAELNIAGARLARQAVGDAAYVLGDVGPFGDFLEPTGDMTVSELSAIFTQQITALKDGGADGIIVETMADPAEVAVAVKAARAVDADWPVIATYSYAPAGGTFKTMMGTPVELAVHEAIAAGASAVGTNCGTGMSLEDYLSLARQLVKAAGKTPVIIQPNAGAPQTTPVGIKYNAAPEDMAKLVPLFRDAGVAIIGGCCGTTPAHLQAMAKNM